MLRGMFKISSQLLIRLGSTEHEDVFLFASLACPTDGFGLDYLLTG